MKIKLNNNDEQYLYGIIRDNVKKYRTLAGLTQEELAEKANISAPQMARLESKSNTAISLNILFVISKSLNIDIHKLFIDENNLDAPKSIKYKCNKCGIENDMPIELVKLFRNINKITNNNNLPSFECTNCDGRLYPLNITEL